MASAAAAYLRAQLTATRYLFKAAPFAVSFAAFLANGYRTGDYLAGGGHLTGVAACLPGSVSGISVSFALVVILLGVDAKTLSARRAAQLWNVGFNIFVSSSLAFTMFACTREQMEASLEKLAADDALYYSSFVPVCISAALVYAEPLGLRARATTLAAHCALRTLQGPAVYARAGATAFARWNRVVWAPTVASIASGWVSAWALWLSGAFACNVMADSLDERYGARSARRFKFPNATLQDMVESLKAEIYELRLRLMRIRSDSGGSSGDTGAAHREEELHEGDIRGSFAEGA